MAESTNLKKNDLAKIDRLLESALMLSPSRQFPFLRRVLADDPAALAKAETLISSYAEAQEKDFMEKPEDGRTSPDVLKIGDWVSLPNSQMYRVVRTAEGGMGQVLFCQNSVAQPPMIALKICRQQYAAIPHYVARFQWEAQAWISLGTHPNIVKAHHVFRQLGQMMIAIEAIQGDDQLGINPMDWMRASRFDAGLAVDFAIQICRGMEHASACFQEMGRRFVHNDLKPSNLLISADRTLKITDFGTVRTLIAAKNDPDQYVLGSPPYMSPEQWEGLADERSDIYACGCVLYELLAGHPPFTGATREEFLAQHRYAAPISVASINPNTPKDLQAIVMRCLSKQPSARYQSFSDLRLGLQKFARESGMLTVSVSSAVEPSPTDLQEQSLALIALEQFRDVVRRVDAYLHAKSLQAPAQARLLEVRGLAKSRLGDHGSGLEDLRNALAINSNSARGLTFYGEALLMEGSLDLAENILKRALAADPVSGAPHLWLCHLYLVQGKFAQAEEILKSCNNLATHAAMVWAYRGLARLMSWLLKDRDRWVAMERRYELKQEEIPFEEWLDTALDVGSLKRDLDQALANDPSCALAYAVRAYAFFQHHNIERCMADLQTVLSATPDSAYELLCRTFLKMCEEPHCAAVQDLALQCLKRPLLRPWHGELQRIAAKRM